MSRSFRWRQHQVAVHMLIAVSIYGCHQFASPVKANPGKPDGTTAKSNVPIKAPTLQKRSDIRAGEIEIAGRLRSVDVTNKKLTFDAIQFTLPSGATRKFATAKSKAIALHQAQFRWKVPVPGLEAPDLTLETLNSQVGKSISVIGKEVGNGELFIARVVRLHSNPSRPAQPVLAPRPSATTPPPQAPRQAHTWPKGHDTPRLLIGFDAAGQLISISRDGQVRIRDVQSGHELAAHKLNATGGMISATLSGNGQTLAAAFHNEGMQLVFWDTATWQASTPLPVQSQVDQARYNEFTGLKLSADGRILATTGFNISDVRIWDIASRKLKSVIKMQPGESSIQFALSPDGGLIATSDRGGLKVWNTASGMEVKTLKSSTYADMLLFSPDGKWLIKNDWHRIDSWDTTSWNTGPALPVEGQITSLAFSADSRFLAVHANQEVLIWNTSNWIRLTQEPVAITGASNSQIALAPDGKTVASTSDYEWVQLFDSALSRPMSSLNLDSNDRVVALTPDNKTLILSNLQESKIVDVATARTRHVLASNSPPVLAPDGNRIATYSHVAQGPGSAIKIWNVATGQEERSIPIKRTMYPLAFSPDGKTLALDGRSDNQPDSGILLLDTTTGTEGRILKAPYNSANTRDISFSPDGKWLATPGAPNTSDLIVWNTATGEQEKVVKSGNSPISAFSFSTNGQWLAGKTSATSFGFWDVKNWQTTKTVEADRVYFGIPDSTFVVTRGHNTIWWDITNWSEKITTQAPERSLYLALVSADLRTLIYTQRRMQVRTWPVPTINDGK